MRYKITGEDWGEPIKMRQSDTQKEVINIILNDIKEEHIGARIRIYDTETGMIQNIDLSKEFFLFGKKFI